MIYEFNRKGRIKNRNKNTLAGILNLRIKSKFS